MPRPFVPSRPSSLISAGYPVAQPSDAHPSTSPHQNTARVLLLASWVGSCPISRHLQGQIESGLAVLLARHHDALRGRDRRVRQWGAR
jgi:hypothetical protein